MTNVDAVLKAWVSRFPNNAYAWPGAPESFAAEAVRVLVPDWQTIDTAPQTGERILLFERGDRGVFEGWWHNDWPHAEHYWMDDRDSEPAPTHWRPLLAHPSLPNGERK